MLKQEISSEELAKALRSLKMNRLQVPLVSHMHSINASGNSREGLFIQQFLFVLQLANYQASKPLE